MGDKTFYISYDGLESAVTVDSSTQTWALERQICTSCGIPWGSVFQLVDKEGAVYTVEAAAIPGASHLDMVVEVTSDPVSMSATVQTINVLEPELVGLAPECKIVVAGDARVGKSSLVACLTGGKMDPGYSPTAGCKITGITTQTNRGPVSCRFWDVGATAEAGGVRDAYYASADALLLCFNFGSQKSYWNVLKWENEVRRVCPSVPIVVVGCGADNSGHIEVPKSTPAIPVSCTDGSGALAAVLHLLRQVGQDPSLAAMADPGMVVPKSDWHNIVEHITGTFPITMT